MDPLTTFVLIGALVVAAAWLAPRLRLPAPLVQLLLGLLVGLLPQVRSIHLPSDAVLVLFLPALLFWEALMTPVTYRVVGFLKRAEHEDYYDRGTNFNPFVLKV